MPQASAHGMSVEMLLMIVQGLCTFLHFTASSCRTGRALAIPGQSPFFNESTYPYIYVGNHAVDKNSLSATSEICAVYLRDCFAHLSLLILGNSLWITVEELPTVVLRDDLENVLTTSSQFSHLNAQSKQSLA